MPEVGPGPVREVLGVTPAPDGPQRLFARAGGPEGLRELAAYVDPLLGIKDFEQKDPPEQRDPPERLPRMDAKDYAILALLDRVGLALPGMLRRAVMPGVAEPDDAGPHQRQAVPQRSGRALADRAPGRPAGRTAVPVRR